MIFVLYVLNQVQTKKPSMADLVLNGLQLQTSQIQSERLTYIHRLHLKGLMS